LSTKQSAARPPKWVAVRDAADLLGITPQGFRQSFLAQLADDAKRAGKPLMVRWDAVLHIAVERRAAALVVDRSDPLLTDGDSPGLERYRLAKAAHAELDLAERKGQLINKEKCRSVLAQWGSVLRRSGDRIARVSPDGSRMLNEALDECETIVKGLE
jgi:hypothetical protein